ncbi:MAG: HDOD domain-containing protein [Planctomycetota bacterium]|jgi:putative nucleotidyltransferase with HDIG domain
MTKVSLDSLAGSIKSIPTLPEVYCKVSDMLENPKVSASSVAEIISRDPSLTAKLLKLVNSAFYGLPQQVSTLTHALVLMGFSTVKSLILTMGLTDIFKASDNADFSRADFWAHCFGTGMMAKSIALRMRLNNVEEIFIQGLLHDIGKIVLDKYAHEEFNKVLTFTRENDCLFVEAEEKILGFTHAEVGAITVKTWNLPDNICNSVKYHHNPLAADNTSEEAALMNLADILCRAKLIGSGGDRQIPELKNDVWEKLGLDFNTLTSIMSEATAFESCLNFFKGN